VRADNIPASSLYEKAGFFRTGSRHNYYEDGMKALLYERDLTDMTPVRRPASGLGQAA
jgi:ribosomal protein S18 acetylase RimI-like enzyme